MSQLVLWDEDVLRDTITLRPYQAQAVDAAFDQWQRVRSTLIVQPTGTGKTVVFSHIIKRIPEGRIMIVAHREELIRQAVDTVKAITGWRTEIEMADLRASRGNPPRIVVSTIQTQIAGRQTSPCW